MISGDVPESRSHSLCWPNKAVLRTAQDILPLTKPFSLSRGTRPVPKGFGLPYCPCEEKGPLAGCDNTHSMRGFFVLLAALALPGVSGCGYHTLGSAAHLPDTVHTLAVPVFKNKTQSYHTEIAMTQAVIREFSDRTRLTITPEAGDGSRRHRGWDHHLRIGAALDLPHRDHYSVTRANHQRHLQLPGNHQRQCTGDRPLSGPDQHNNYVFHEQFETTADVTSFIEEDTPAVQRLSRDFAQALVSDILESF